MLKADYITCVLSWQTCYATVTVWVISCDCDLWKAPGILGEGKGSTFWPSQLQYNGPSCWPSVLAFHHSSRKLHDKIYLQGIPLKCFASVQLLVPLFPWESVLVMFIAAEIIRREIWRHYCASCISIEIFSRGSSKLTFTFSINKAFFLFLIKLLKKILWSVMTRIVHDTPSKFTLRNHVLVSLRVLAVCVTQTFEFHEKKTRIITGNS